jgi:sulfur transfer protein SufE
MRVAVHTVCAWVLSLHDANARVCAATQVWVVPELRDDGNVYWSADSDSQLTKV